MRAPLEISFTEWAILDKYIILCSGFHYYVYILAGGKKVAIVLKLQMTWERKYENIENEETKPFVAALKASVSRSSVVLG